MIKIQTARLIIYSDASILDGMLVFPQTKRKEIDLLEIKPHQPQTTGFAIYLKDDNTKPVGQFGFRHDRYENELEYGTNEPYRRKGYMREAMEAFIPWFFQNTSSTIIYGIIAEGNVASENLALEVGFKRTGKCIGGSPLYSITRP